MDTEKNTKCEWCGAPLALAGTGRPRRYCSPTCKRKAFDARHAPDPLQEPEEVGEDETIDLDAMPTAALAALAKELGVSLEGDREAVIARILEVAELADETETDETPAPERNETKPRRKSGTLATVQAMHAANQDKRRPKPKARRPERPRLW